MAKRIKTFYLIISLFYFFPFFPLLSKNLPINPIKILIINSYSADYPSFTQYLNGLNSVFKKEHTNLSFEFLDTKRFPYESIKKNFKDYFIFKNSDLNEFCLIMASDDNALKFILENIEGIFKKSKIVFFGINNINLTKKALKHPNITGVHEVISITDNLSIINKIHSNDKSLPNINVICDSTPSGIADLKQILNFKKNNLNIKINIIDLCKITFSDLSNILLNLNTSDPIYLISAYRDKNNHKLSYHSFLRLIKKSFSGPIYQAYMHGLNYGITGGKMVSHYGMAQNAAFMALQILAGTDTCKIKPILEYKNNIYFDYKELKKNRISLNRIPENSIIINKPVSFYQKFKIQIITLISIIIFLTILCMYLSNYITKMHNLENELQKNKEQLKKTIDNIHDFVITTDESGKILQTNRMLLDKFSLNKNNILGLNIKTFLSEYDIFNNSQKTDSNIVNSDNTSLKTNFKGYIYDQNKDNDNTNNDNTNYNNKNDVFSYTEELIGLNKIEKSKFDECFSKKSSIILNNFKFGNIVLKGICSPIKLEKMNSTIFVFTLKDRTEEFKREVIIKNQNIILHSMFEKTPYLISILDDKNRFLLVNKSFEKITGYTLSQALGKSIEQIKLFESSSNNNDILRKLFNKQEMNNQEIKIQCKDKKQKVIFLSVHKIYYMEKECLLLMGTDITEPFKLTQDLMQMSKLDTLGQLAGGITHDFNNVLCGILNSAELLKEEIQNEELLDYIDIIIKLIAQASDLTSGVLSFTRKSGIEKKYTDLKNTLNTCITILKRTLNKNIQIQNIIDADNTVISGNENLLLNSFLNLAINASHAMPNGGNLVFRTRKVHIDPLEIDENKFNLKSGNYLEIQVSDTGSGIKKEIIDKIFDPFFTTKKENKGTGIGLSSVFTTIKRHNGAISVESEPGKGTNFKLLLPLSSEKSDENENNYTKNNSSHTGSILIIDDEKIVRTTLKMILKNFGYKVITAENGKAGIKTYSFAPHDFDLIILDMIMPQMNGEECFYKLKKINKEAKIIICSGFTEDVDINKLQRDGLTGFIRKPFRKNQILEIINSAVKK